MFLLLNVLCFYGDANKVERKGHEKYFLPKVEINNYNVLIDGRKFHDELINNSVKKSNEIRKFTTGKEMIAQQDAC